MKPAKRVVICEPIKLKTTSGLVVDVEDKGEKPPEIGKVIEIGEGKKPVSFNVGDVIVYRRYADNKIVIQGKSYNFLEFKDILAVLPQE